MPPRGRVQIALIVTLAVAGAVGLSLCVLLYRLIVDRGRLLLQIQALESRLGELHEIPTGEEVDTVGFPVGSPAPDFALPDLTGSERPLEEWRGRRLLLVFFDPDCGFSLDLLGRFAEVRPHEEPGAPVPVVVATGAPERISALASEYDLGCTVLLQDHAEVSGLYKDAQGASARPADLPLLSRRGGTPGRLSLLRDALGVV